MTFPVPLPPQTVGTQPIDANQVNLLVGTHLRNFLVIKGVIDQDASWLATVDLKAAPYYFDAGQETLIKSAVADLDTSLDAINMTFISRLIGLAP